jgi:hypothetical protein
MKRIPIVFSSILAAILVMTLFNLECFFVACKSSAFWWESSDFIFTIKLFCTYFLFFVIPISLISRSFFTKKFLAVFLASSLCTLLLTMEQWHLVVLEYDKPFQHAIIYITIPFILACLTYSWLVVKYWPTNRLEFSPIMWCLVSLFTNIFISSNLFLNDVISHQYNSIIKDLIPDGLFLIFMVPICLPAFLGIKWPTITKICGFIFMIYALYLPINSLFNDGLPTDVAWIFGAITGLVAFAHLTLRSCKKTTS